jgi:hypothetical protein
MIQLFNHQRSGCVTSFFTQGNASKFCQLHATINKLHGAVSGLAVEDPVEGITIFGIKNSMINPKENNTYLVFLNIFFGVSLGLSIQYSQRILLDINHPFANSKRPQKATYLGP